MGPAGQVWVPGCGTAGAGCAQPGAAAGTRFGQVEMRRKVRPGCARACGGAGREGDTQGSPAAVPQPRSLWFARRGRAMLGLSRVSWEASTQPWGSAKRGDATAERRRLAGSPSQQPVPVGLGQCCWRVPSPSLWSPAGSSAKAQQQGLCWGQCRGARSAPAAQDTDDLLQRGLAAAGQGVGLPTLVAGWTAGKQGS